MCIDIVEIWFLVLIGKFCQFLICQGHDNGGYYRFTYLFTICRTDEQKRERLEQTIKECLDFFPGEYLTIFILSVIQYMEKS